MISYRSKLKNRRKRAKSQINQSITRVTWGKCIPLLKYHGLDTGDELPVNASQLVG